MHIILFCESLRKQLRSGESIKSYAETCVTKVLLKTSGSWRKIRWWCILRSEHCGLLGFPGGLYLLHVLKWGSGESCALFDDRILSDSSSNCFFCEQQYSFRNAGPHSCQEDGEELLVCYPGSRYNFSNLPVRPGSHRWNCLYVLRSK